MLNRDMSEAPQRSPLEAWPLRPAVGFLHPLDVVKDPDLDVAAKRQILASWASDVSAVEGRPGFRWLLGTDEPVHLIEIHDAQRALARRYGAT